MQPSFFLRVFSWIVLLSMILVACTSSPSLPLKLASFAENDVSVSIKLEQLSAGNYIVSATFTPPDGYHLYSKDIPIHGINGIGRPTLIELTSDSSLKALAGLAESIPAENFYFEHNEFMVYPLGAVTLSLPVEIPQGKRWLSDKLKITFMACSSTQCKPPVEGKIISIRIPAANMFDD